jgi:ATP-dependent Lhr-like helicase
VPAQRVLAFIRKHGASFFADIRTGTQLSLDALNKGIAELFWAGMITNDLFAEVQSIKRYQHTESTVPVERIEMLDPRHHPRRGGLMGSVRKAIRQVPGWSGRWSLVHLPGVLGEEISLEERAHRQALQLLARYGIVARELYRREELLPWPLVAASLQSMEMRGEVRRGYFIEGLSGMQFAWPAAVEELRRLRSSNSSASIPVVVNACDPANPLGPGISPGFSQRNDERQIARIASNYVVFVRGTPILVIENYGARLWTMAETTDENMRSGIRIFMATLQQSPHVRSEKKIKIEHFDGTRPVQSSIEPILLSLGFTLYLNQTMVYDGYV